MAYLAAQQLDTPDRRKVSTQAAIRGIGPLRQDQPDAVILRGPDVVSEHHEQSIAAVNSES